MSKGVVMNKDGQTMTYQQRSRYLVVYIAFAVVSLVLMMYYLSNTIIHFTTDQQFPINSFERFPLTWLIFPAELFSFLFSLYFVYNLINGNTPQPRPRRFENSKKTPVAVLIPVYNEPREIVERTLAACRQLKWPGGVTTYLLDDSTTSEHKQDSKELAAQYGAVLVTRNDRDGYKAGNINNAIKHHVKEPYFAIFDSDQAPEPDFFVATMDHFTDKQVAFVQTPQHFINSGTLLERAQKLGSNIFYQAQCQSKAKDHAMPFCGTNVVVRTGVFKKVNGLCYYTSTEDIELGLRMNEIGYYGAYVPKVLAKGYATTDFTAYASQQYRWANGNLAILRQSWLHLLLGKFTFRQQMHTFFTTGWWFVGLTSLMYILVPMLSFFFGGTHHTWMVSWMLGVLFLNVAIGVSMIYFALQDRDNEDKVTVADAFLQYSLITNSMFIYAKAAINALFKRYVGFVRTNKKRQRTGYSHIRWNLVLAALCFGFSVFGLYQASTVGGIDQLRTYLPISFWLLFYAVIFSSSIIFVGETPVEHEMPQAVAQESRSKERNSVGEVA